MLASINPGTLPLVVGVIIVGTCSLIPCFIGYHIVHIYERYAWMVITLVMLILWGLGAHAGFDVNAGRAEEPTGMSLAANVLSFGGIVFYWRTSLFIFLFFHFGYLKCVTVGTNRR
jgi:purine-cytosine permease-like protein